MAKPNEIAGGAGLDPKRVYNLTIDISSNKVVTEICVKVDDPIGGVGPG